MVLEVGGKGNRGEGSDLEIKVGRRGSWDRGGEDDRERGGGNKCHQHSFSNKVWA